MPEKNNKKKKISIPVMFAVALLGLAVGNHARAADVFRWVDENGVVHFSQWAPDDVHNITTVTVSSGNPRDYDPTDDPYSVRNQAARINETWQAIEEKIAERREKKREKKEETARYAVLEYHEPYHYYASSFLHGPIYRPVRPPGHRPPYIRPPHVRPPVHPGKPQRPVKPVDFSPDPMRSAHIGVRR